MLEEVFGPIFCSRSVPRHVLPSGKGVQVAAFPHAFAPIRSNMLRPRGEESGRVKSEDRAVTRKRPDEWTHVSTTG